MNTERGNAGRALLTGRGRTWRKRVHFSWTEGDGNYLKGLKAKELPENKITCRGALRLRVGWGEGGVVEGALSSIANLSTSGLLGYVGTVEWQ